MRHPPAGDTGRSRPTTARAGGSRRSLASLVVGERWPLVGRDDELAHLARLLGPGGGRGAAVFGDAGVGKTRLVADTVAARHDQGTTVEWVRATEATRGIPLGSLAHLDLEQDR